MPIRKKTLVIIVFYKKHINLTSFYNISEFEKETLENPPQMVENNVPIHWDLMGMDQDNEFLIRAIKEKVLWHPPYPKRDIHIKYEDLEDTLRGQDDQPLYAEKILKKHNIWDPVKPGFYIEAGAAGGELYSNTLYFEMKYNWTGLLVEPSPIWWKELKSKNRNAWILPHCLSTEKKVHLIDFYSFSEDFVDFAFMSRTDMDHDFYENFKANHPNALNKLKVQCFPLQAVLKAIELPKVQYFSLDIEGAEYDVLKTIDFNVVDFSVFSIEIEDDNDNVMRLNSGSNEDLHKYLKQNGYDYIDRVGRDNFFVKN